jgi:hypothetical protein
MFCSPFDAHLQNPAKTKPKTPKGKPAASPVKKRHERLHTKTVITFDKVIS